MAAFEQRTYRDGAMGRVHPAAEEMNDLEGRIAAAVIGMGSGAILKYTDGAYPTRPTAVSAAIFIGPTDPDAVATGADVWIPWTPPA